MPRRKLITKNKVDVIDTFILQLHLNLIEEYSKILPHNFFDGVCPRRSNSGRITRLHNKLNTTIQKRNYLFLYEPCSIEFVIKQAKKQMLELQLKCRRHSMQRTRVVRITRELYNLDNMASWNVNALSILERQCKKSNAMIMELLGL
jgi:hypothetical protein